MSLEAVIQENTAVMRELIARLTASALAQPGPYGGVGIPPAATATASNTVAATTSTEPATAETKVEEKKPAATPTVQETKAAADAPAAESPSEPAAPIDYAKDVKPLLVKVSTTKGRDALVGLLDKFGVTKGDQLPQDKLADVISEVHTLLAA